MLCTAPGETRSRLSSELTRRGFEVHVASGQLDAQAHVSRSPLAFDLVVVDAALTALPVVDALTRQARPPKIIIVAPVARELANRDATRLHATVVDHSATPRDIAAAAASQVSPMLPR
ncbi:MAG: hypothetical protein QM723_20310 [Myxococcaceae bacterium]